LAARFAPAEDPGFATRPAATRLSLASAASVSRPAAGDPEFAREPPAPPAAVWRDAQSASTAARFFGAIEAAASYASSARSPAPIATIERDGGTRGKRNGERASARATCARRSARDE
jgi:hypothetical protein